jgi:hypothetical protein
VLVLGVGGREQVVEFPDGVHDRHRDAVGAAESATLSFDAALLVRTFLAGLAVEGVEAVVRAERDPALRLGPVAAEQHSGDGGLQVVVADLV